MTTSLSLEDLAELPHRIERLELEVTQLRERLGALEPPAAPLTVRQFCDRFGWSENQVRWLLFNREKNGLAEAVSGRGRLLIDATRFFEILQRDKRAGSRR
jgi:DNA-binding GntR family transcriptional regulator